MSKRKQFIAIISLLSIMLGMSLLGGSRGVLVPALKQSFDVTDSTIGMMFLISTFGYMSATFFAGRLIYRLGNKRSLQLGTSIVVVSMAIMFWSPSFFIYGFGFLLNGVGNAFILLGVNLTAPLFTVAFQAALLNIIHGSYGLGSAFVQRVSGYLISNEISWRYLFLGFIIYHTSVLVYVTLTSYPKLEEKAVDPAMLDEADRRPKPSIYSNKLLYLYIVTMGLGLIGEHGINNWFVNYMKEGFGIGENEGSTYLALFFILFTIGRFFGGFLLERVGYLKGIIYAQLITFVIYTAGIMLGEQGLYLITAAGILQAVFYPTMMLTIPKVFKSNPAQAMAAVSIGASVINNGGSYLMGLLNDNIGVIRSYYMLPVAVMLSGLVLVAICRNLRTCEPETAAETVDGLAARTR